MAPEEIADGDLLYRRIFRGHIDPDGRVNSGAFVEPSGELSVDLARLTTAEETAARSRAERPMGVSGLLARHPRELDYEVRHDPNPPEEPENGSHSLVIGDFSSRTKRRLLAQNAFVALAPADAETS